MGHHSYLLILISIGAEVYCGSVDPNKTKENVGVISPAQNVVHTSSNSLHSTMGYKENGMFQATLLFASKPIGLIECQDATPQKAMQFFEQILGKDANFNESNYLCGPTCRGKCVPRPDHVGIPPSIYPFGCNCDILNGCDIKGPNAAPLANAAFKVACKSDRRCTCVGMGPGQFIGYTCAFVNTISGKVVTYAKKKVDEQGTPPAAPPRFGTKFFPLEWCSCCPNFPILRKGEKLAS